MTTTSSVTSGSTNSSLQSYIDAQAALASSATASTTSSSSSSSSTSMSSLTGDFNTFLKILTTQLQNQDPTNATDPNQFTQELVEFSGVEQQLNTNKKLDNILSAINSNGITPLMNYVGKTVEATTSDGSIVVQNGTSTFGYTLAAEASSASVTVKNSSGKTVATLTGGTAEGTNRVSWDGKCTDGTAAEDGVYTISVAAKDSSATTVKVTDTRAIGVVTGIETTDSVTKLQLGDLTIKDTAIDAVFSSTTSSSTADSSTSSTNSTSST